MLQKASEDLDVRSAVTAINDLLLARRVEQALFSKLASILSRCFNYPFCALVLFDESLSQLELVGINREGMDELISRHGRGNPPRRKFQLKDVSGLKWLQYVLEGELYVTSDPREMAAPFMSRARTEAMVRVIGLQLAMAVPLVARGKLLGTILIGSNRSELSPDERSDLVFLAQHTAVALQMWFLYDRSEGRTALLNKLHALSRGITSTLDLDKLYVEVVTAAGQLADIDLCAANLLTGDKQGYENRAAWFRSQRSAPAGSKHTFDRYPGDWVRPGLRGDVLLFDDPSLMDDTHRKLLPNREVAAAAMALAIFPFRSQGEVVGFITVGRETTGKWAQADVEVFKQLSEYVSVAVTNARLYRDATRRAERLATLHRTGDELTRIHDQKLLFASLHDSIAKTVDAPIFQLGLWHPEVGKLDSVLRIEQGQVTETFEHLSEEDLAVRAAAERRTFYEGDIHDAAQPAVARAVTEDGPPVRSALYVPLLAGERVVGALTIKSYLPYAYDVDDIQTVQIVASQAAVALDNIRLLEDAEFRTTQQSALARSARMIARADTDEDVLRAIAATASLLTSGSYCRIYLTDHAGGLVCTQSYGGYSGPVIVARIDEDEGMLGRVFLTGSHLMLGDIQQNPVKSARFEQITRDFDIHSVAAVPLQTEHEKIGVLLVCNTLPNLYTFAHLDLLNTLADHTTIALEKQQLLASARRKADEQEALVESARAIARLDLKTVLETIVSKASAIVSSSKCSILLYDEKTAELYWAAGYHTMQALRSLRLPSSEGVMGYIFTTGESLLLEDVMSDPRGVRKDIDEQENAHSFLGVPLRGPNGNLGVLVTTRSEVGVFSARDLELLSTFADHATVAIYNAYLYNSLQQREAERARLLHQVLTSQEAERRRMAVDIHDGPLQSIGVNLLAVDRVRKHMADGRAEEALLELNALRGGMTAVVQELRDVISDLRPALLDTQGLVIATQSHLRIFTEHYDISTLLQDDLGDRRFPATLEITFYRLMQEALTNVRKHANATQVRVRIENKDNVASMCISDNGRGFEPEKGMTEALASGHIGLHSMSERIEMIGGCMEVVSSPGGGTRLTFKVPLPHVGAA